MPRNSGIRHNYCKKRCYEGRWSTAKITNREKLLKVGLRLMHERGLAASARKIVEAAGVPQGSFTNHFASKEAFCLEILNLYDQNALGGIERTLRNDSLPPLKHSQPRVARCNSEKAIQGLPQERLHDYLDLHAHSLKAVGKENGCLYGNFTAETSEHSENVRIRLVDRLTTV